MDDELRGLIDAGLDPDFAREFLAAGHPNSPELRRRGGAD